MQPKPFRVLRVGKINRLEVAVLVPRFQPLNPEKFHGIGIGVHETSEGPALAITIAGGDGLTATALITPDRLGPFMGILTESTSRLAETLIPEGKPE